MNEISKKPDQFVVALTEQADALSAYSRLASDSIADAASWMRQGSLARAIPEAIPDALMVVNERGTIVSVNAQFELMFGHHRSQVIGRTPEMLLPEQFRDSHVPLRCAFADDPRVRDMLTHRDLNAVRRNGTQFRASVRLGPVMTPEGLFIITTIRRLQD
jgi:PAS domain S-box-containing protein